MKFTIHLVVLGLVIFANANGHDRAAGRPVYRGGRCFLTPELGVCSDKVLRWYYNVASGRCHRFLFGGCGGNANNFYNKDYCEEVCARESRERPPGSSMKPLFLYHKKELYVPHPGIISNLPPPPPPPTNMKKRGDRYKSGRRSKGMRRNIELIPIRRPMDRDRSGNMNYVHNVPPTMPLPRAHLSGLLGGQNRKPHSLSYSRTNLYPTGPVSDPDRSNSGVQQRRSFTVVSLYLDPKPNISPPSDSGFPRLFFNSQGSYGQRSVHPLRRMMPMLFNLPWLFRFPLTSQTEEKSNEDIVTDGLLSRALFRRPLPSAAPEEISHTETTDFSVAPSSTPELPPPEAKVAQGENSLTTRPPPRPEHERMTTTPLPQGPDVDNNEIENPEEHITPPRSDKPHGKNLDSSSSDIGTYAPFSPEPETLEVAPPGIYRVSEASTPSGEYSDSSASSPESLENIPAAGPPRLAGPIGFDGHDTVLPPGESIGKMGRDAPRFDKSICFLPMDPGPCRAAIPQWFYNSITRKCEFFFYGGCLGMPNRFETEESCASLCMADTETTATAPQTANANPKPPVKEQVTKTLRVEPTTTQEPPTTKPLENKIFEEEVVVEQDEKEIMKEHTNRFGKEALAGLVEATPIRVQDDMEYATVIVIMCIVGIAIIVLFSLGLMYAIRRIKKTKKEKVIEAVLRAHIYGDRPKLGFAGQNKGSKA